MSIIEADANRLRRVFVNLLDNALKFSKDKGTITIATQETEREVIIKVIDEGIGIDAKDMPYIFDPFNRAEEEGKREGFGLGLAIVKAIVKGHGGRVLVESELGERIRFLCNFAEGNKGFGRTKLRFEACEGLHCLQRMPS